jgi:aspartate kinase
MKVFKFGGASVKDAEGIRNLAKIVMKETDNLVIVVSAFGKTTNALEKVLKAWLDDDKKFATLLDTLKQSHSSVVSELFGPDSEMQRSMDISFALLNDHLLNSKGEYDFEYDQIVSYGEVWSTRIVASYLIKNGFNASWIDLREILVTDDRYRDANVLWLH